MKRQFPLTFDGIGIPILSICEWYVNKYDLPYTAEQFLNAGVNHDHLTHAARLFFAELRAMDARITVDPRFNFSVDVTALVKLDQVLSFFRNANPTHKDADIEQLTILVKTTMKNIREYDDALRGLTVSTTRSEIQPQVENTEAPAHALPEQPRIPPANPAAIQAPGSGFAGGPTISARPPGAPPPHVTQSSPTSSRPEQKPAQTPNMAPPGFGRPEPSGAPVPGTPPPQITEDAAVRALTPRDSGARFPAGPHPIQKPQNGPPGGPPVAGGFTPPGHGSPHRPAAGPPGVVPGGPPPAAPDARPPATPPRDTSQSPPAVPPGAPPPPNLEF